MAAPLHDLTQKATQFAWTERCQQAFDSVKYAMTHAPVLAMPDFKKPFEVICDASVNGVGAVLMQDGYPIAFESKKFTPAERNYATGQQELLGVVHALKSWRCFLEGIPFTLVTDHEPLKYFQDQKSLSRMQARWLEFMQSTFRFDWQYKPGRVNVADPLSRRPDMEADTTTHGSVQLMFHWNFPVDKNSLTAQFAYTVDTLATVIHCELNHGPHMICVTTRGKLRRVQDAPTTAVTEADVDNDSNSQPMADLPSTQFVEDFPPAPVETELLETRDDLRDRVKTAYAHDPWFADTRNTSKLT